MRPWITAALYIAFVLAVALVALSAQSDASRALPDATNPHIAALLRQEGGVVTVIPTDTNTVTSAAPTTVPSASNAAGALPIVSHGTTPVATSVPRHSVGSPLLAGWATTYDDGPGLYASAGPDVRRVMPWYHHGVVMVCAFPNGRSNCSAIPTVGWCACGFRHGIPTLLDLSPDAYALLCQAPAGVCKITVEVLR